jgi:tetratricopeptide (TPR) repeat protein
MQLNEAAVKSMKKTSQTAFRLLRVAETLLNSLEDKGVQRYDLVRLKALTFNNFGCYFQERGKYLAALEYLQKTLEVEQSEDSDQLDIRQTAYKAGSHKLKQTKSIAITMLNLAAVLSKLKRHPDALEFAREAVGRLEHVKGADSDLELNSVLSTGYYNYAIELECLGRQHEANCFYDQAYRVALSRLGVAPLQTRKFKEKADFTRTKKARPSTDWRGGDVGNSSSSSESRPLVVLGQFYK